MNTANTRFAPAGRATDQAVRDQTHEIAQAPFISHAFDCVHEMVVILNEHRQIVFANRQFFDSTENVMPETVFGRRPGEVIGCLHANAPDAPDGCGTSPSCSTCGAVRAVMMSQKAGDDVQECSIALGKGGEGLNLRVRASQFELDGKHYTICAMDDISHEKRREELEKIFFHDILNTASAVKGLAEVVEIVPSEKQAEFLQNIRAASVRLIDEINSHRLLATAETGELRCTLSPIDSLEVLRDAMLLFSHHDSAKDRHLVLAPTTESVSFETDRGLLSRVIVNMIKNALEATPEGESVTVDCRRLDDWVRFSVHNPVYIPQKVAMQIFRRSFSTKGRGRGLGTYGMRLISEKYLNGRVTFTTSKASGTVFMASYPVGAVT